MCSVQSAQFRLKPRKVLSSGCSEYIFFKNVFETRYSLKSFPKQQIKVRRPTGLFNVKVQRSIPRKSNLIKARKMLSLAILHVFFGKAFELLLNTAAVEAAQ